MVPNVRSEDPVEVPDQFSSCTEISIHNYKYKCLVAPVSIIYSDLIKLMQPFILCLLTRYVDIIQVFAFKVN